jgi:hypothetical protein
MRDKETTILRSVNHDGAVAGDYNISRVTPRHSFARDEHGAITTFDTPGLLTFPTGIHDEDAITGYYCAAVGPCHGFVLAR